MGECFKYLLKSLLVSVDSVHLCSNSITIYRTLKIISW